MISIKWVITDDLSNVTVEEFDYEWNGIISGYFELVINEKKEGFCPERKIDENEEGIEDILYWLIHLSDGLKKIKKGEKYEMLLLTMNKYKLLIELNSAVEFQFVNEWTNEIKWKEVVEMQEFEIELCDNIDGFIKYIRAVNPQLLNSIWIKRLMN